MRTHHIWRSAVLAGAVVTLLAARTDAQTPRPQVRDLQEETLTARDGTAFAVTSGTVRVPELRTAGRSSSATIDRRSYVSGVSARRAVRHTSCSLAAPAIRV